MKYRSYYKKKRLNMKAIIIVIALVVSIGIGLFFFMNNDSNDVPNIDDNPTNTIIIDDSLDPENTESNQEDGKNINADELKQETGYTNGIDVSKWQGKIDWKKVKKDNIDFAIIRIGYRGEDGKIYKDANADYNIQQAQKNDILVGAYFFSTAINETEAKEEANWTLKAVEGYSISYPIVYDCEGFQNSNSRMFSLSNDTRTTNALSFMNVISDKGYDVMFYTSLNDSYEYWNMNKIENKYKIWIAQYTSVIYPEKQKPDYNGICHAWQYTNKGHVNGINGNVDMVVCYFEKKKADPLNKDAAINDAKAPLTNEEKIYKKVEEKVTAKDVVNLRKDATTKSDVVGTMKNGDILTRVGIGTNGWSKVQYNGQVVYAISSYLTTDLQYTNKPSQDIVADNVFTAQKDKVTAKDTVNLRSLPTTGGELLGTLKNGEVAERVAVSNKGWSRLIYNGQTVYAITSYLTTDLTSKNENNPTNNEDVVAGHTFTPKNDQVTAKDLVNLRSQPNSDSEKVGELKSGDFLQRVAISNKGWSRLVYNGQTVYAITSYLTNEVVNKPNESDKPVSDGFTSVDEQVTAKQETNLRTKPSTDNSEVVYKLTNGEYIKRVGINSSTGWSKLEYNGQTVYAISSYLTK